MVPTWHAYRRPPAPFFFPATPLIFGGLGLVFSAPEWQAGGADPRCRGRRPDDVGPGLAVRRAYRTTKA
jgi:hypothetical protein